MDDSYLISKLFKPEVRIDRVPPDAYVLPEYVKLETEKLWPRVWLMACREEQFKKVGDYVTFDIGQESFLFVKVTADRIKAYFNVCQHRGRRLKDLLSGNTAPLIYCPFHGWRYNLDGSIHKIYSRADWAGCPNFTDEDMRLREVRMEKWAGWLWISMDPKIEPLLDYLSPVPELLQAYELQATRFAWAKSVVVQCNWKVVVDAFNEAYHAPATHPTTFRYGAPGSYNKIYGRHGAFFQRSLLDEHRGELVVTLPPGRIDIREKVAYHAKLMFETSHSMVSRYSYRSALRVKELPDGLTDVEVMQKWKEFHREELEADGAIWPQKLTDDVLATAATDYHIFPNTTFVPVLDGALWHRMRPNGDDPDSCIWDIWSLERFPPGKEPEVTNEFFPSREAFKGQNRFLEEDFANMQQVQKGMKSRSFRGGRTNPVQELTVSNFHRVLYEYLFADGPVDPKSFR
jgi:phenylpropionate dioxygenase-like ring-hydroxylating dioxygenase large terminal subunit